MQHNINTAGTVLTVSDGGWTASVRTLGAELQSVRDPQGHEYIWQGDPAVWSGRSPLLFPIVGRQKDDTLDYGNGTEYKMKAHGFAKTQIFSVASRTEREAELILYDNEATRSQYPFAFSLRSAFSLSSNVLTVRRTVRNTGDQPLPFLLGEHIGFCVPMEEGLTYSDYRVRFEKRETLDNFPLNGDHYLDTHEPYINNEDILPLDPLMFANDARILRDPVSRSVRLESARGSRSVQVDFPDYTSLGLWAKPRAPYLCIEPWVGHDSFAGDSHLMSEKDSLVVLASGEERTFTCVVSFFA